MSSETIERELDDLKRRLEKLEISAEGRVEPSWIEAFGNIPDDELTRSAARLGAEWRQQENQRK